MRILLIMVVLLCSGLSLWKTDKLSEVSRVLPFLKPVNGEPPALPVHRQLPPVPDLRERGIRMGQGAGSARTPDQQAEERKIWQEQIESAAVELASPDPLQRISGAQQLGAYPGQDSAKLLVQTLTMDNNAEVRQAAAESFMHWPDPGKEIIQALLKVLRDDQAEVRHSTLSTLETQLGSSSLGKAQRQQILGGMRKLTKPKSLDPVSREELLRILSEQ